MVVTEATHGPAPATASLRLLARRINEAEALAAQLVTAMTRAHGELVSGRHDAAAQLLQLGLRKAAAYGDRS